MYKIDTWSERSDRIFISVREYIWLAKKQHFPWVDFVGVLVCLEQHHNLSESVKISFVAVLPRLTHNFLYMHWTNSLKTSN